VPTLPVQAAGLFLGRPVPESKFDDNTAWVDFPGGPGTVPTYSLVDVVRGRVPASAVAGKIVIVGPNDPLEKDVIDTPASDAPLPGPELQADATATVLDGFPLRSASGFTGALLLVTLALPAPLLAIRRSALLVLLGALAALVLFLLGAQLAYDSGAIVNVTEPLLALLIGTAGALIAHYAMVTRERRHLRSLFSRFVPAQVVDEVIERVDDDLRLGGVRRDGTVMFCDLRGFTTFSEELEPERVVEVVNRYLSEMSEAILANGGTLVSFMGDGIMALFGAPIEQPDHARRAFAAAREMVTVRLPRWNQWLRDNDLGQGFKMGIGLNSGPFMSGNIGSRQRLAYTAMGDTINTASRIEGMTKGTPYMLFVADSTKELLGDDAHGLLYIDEVEVRGRTTKLKLWAFPETPL